MYIHFSKLTYSLYFPFLYMIVALIFFVCIHLIVSELCGGCLARRIPHSLFILWTRFVSANSFLRCSSHTPRTMRWNSTRSVDFCATLHKPVIERGTERVSPTPPWIVNHTFVQVDSNLYELWDVYMHSWLKLQHGFNWHFVHTWKAQSFF